MDKRTYTPTIGLEIHAELKTASKMFCSCPNNPDEEKPNTNICPICLGHPGTLPVLNKEAVRAVLTIGCAVNGTLADFTEWDRKNYFYPDIPKGYQISQFKYPLVSGGTLAGVELERIHLEEDTAQSTHDLHTKSLVNFNRSGVPLMELVTKPFIHDAATAVHFAKELQLLLRYLAIGDANLEKGEMRIEANISVSTDSTLGTKTEIKNLNSFRAVEGAITYEIERQTSLLEDGGKVVQETRGWDDNLRETYSQRSKESSHDYRYFPEPDIPKMKISELPEFARAVLMKSLPELPSVKRARYSESYGLTEKEVAVFVDSPHLSDYFEKVISSYDTDLRKVKLSANYFLSDYLGMLKKSAGAALATTTKVPPTGKSLDKESEVKAESVEGSLLPVDQIPPASFADLINLVASGEISSRGAKDLMLHLMNDPNAKAAALAEKHGLIQKSSTADLAPIIDKILKDNEKAVSEYKAGKTASLQFLIGQAMKATKGSANPEVLRKLMTEKLA